MTDHTRVPAFATDDYREITTRPLGMAAAPDEPKVYAAPGKPVRLNVGWCEQEMTRAEAVRLVDTLCEALKVSER